MATIHKNLTGADLHEPKGADTALAGRVYVSNGAGSGSWTDAASVITNTAFTTGDAKLTLKSTADTGWILFDDGTIGDGSSGATTRANADTQPLFNLLWPLADCVISGGKGASAAADYAAHKAISIPKTLGRALAIAGAGSGLTSRALASVLGGESKTLGLTDLPPVNITVTPASYGFSSSSNQWLFSSGANAGAPSGNPLFAMTAAIGAGTVTGTVTVNPVINTGVGTPYLNQTGQPAAAFSLMQPTTFLNIMVKL